MGSLPAQLQSGNQPPEGINAAITAWNMMGGLDWAGFPIVVDVLGVSDPELLIAQLVKIRDQEQESE